MSTFQYTKQPKPEGYRTGQRTGGDALARKKPLHGVAKPEPAAVVGHRKTGRVVVKKEATEAAVKEEAAETVVKEEEAAAPVEGAGFCRGSRDSASIGNPVKRERRRVGGGRGPGTSSSPQAMKRKEKNGKNSARKADRKVKVKAEGKRGGGENISPKKIAPRLAEKAALILNVMDALYPDPPIPINHMVRGERCDERGSRLFVCTAEAGRAAGLFLYALTRGGRFFLVVVFLFRGPPIQLVFCFSKCLGRGGI